VRAGELPWELEDVTGARGAKPVDRLEVIAHDGQARPGPTQVSHDVHLQPVDVLVLIDQHVLEALSDQRADDLVGRERAPVQQQVIEIEHAERPLARAVAAKDLRERLVMLLAPRERFGQHLGQRRLGVDGPRVDVLHRLRAREAPCALGVTVFLAQVVEQIGRVTRVQHPKAGIEAQRGGM